MTEKNQPGSEQEQMELSLLASNRDSLGVINLEFLLQSIGGLTNKVPLCLDHNLEVGTVIRKMVERKVGSVLLTDESGKVVGIFTERDYLNRFGLQDKDPVTTPIREVSTLKPIMVPPETTIAFALNLMSHGGFRHLPIVDEHDMPLGVVSVRDVIDRISQLLVQDIMSFG